MKSLGQSTGISRATSIRALPTIETRIIETGGHASGFDYMRLCLSLSIIILHSAITGYGLAADQAMFESPARPLLRFILPAFFALSGFLVAGSLERSKTLFMFLGLRVLRIYPALAVEVLLSALILGPLLTTVPLHQYYTDHRFFLYLRNVVGDIHFYLPGMFANNPLPGTVNGQLWTVPFELGCYVTLAGISLLGIKKHRILGPIFVGLVTASYLAVTLIRHHGVIVPVPGAINGALLVATFLAGVSIYMYRDLLPLNTTIGILAGALALILLKFGPIGDFLAPIPAAYFTVYLGLLNPSRRLLPGGDYSYGIFLYGFAIQQTIVYLIPIARFWPVNIVISIPAVVLFAAMSWHLVEKPAQGFRAVLKKWEARLLARWPAASSTPVKR